jgi:hypothetical protein
VDDDVGGLDEDDSKPSAVTSSALLIGACPVQDVVQEEATTTPGDIPFVWMRVKLEPDC